MPRRLPGDNMKIKKAELKAVAVKPGQYPEDNMAEVAFAGRSNVGKSSLINLLLNRKKLARVGGSPGKTRTINFYEINDAFRIVDLPGYGYAKVSKSVTENWGRMMETYLAGRESLLKVIQLVDIRHQPTAQDVQMYQWLRHYGLDGIVVATKADKISRNEVQRNISLIRKTLGLSPEDLVLPVSTLKRSGTDRLLQVMEDLISVPEDLAQEGLEREGLEQEGLGQEGLEREGLGQEGLEQEGLGQEGLEQAGEPGSGPEAPLEQKADFSERDPSRS